MGRFRMMVRGFVPTPDTTPDAFSFTDLTGQTEGASVTGDPVTITGINASTSFTVTGGTVQINGAGSFVSSGSAVNNDTLTPKGTANATYLGTTDVVVTVGGVSDTFTITTRADPGASYSLGVIAAGLEYVVDQKTDGSVGVSGPQTRTYATHASYLTGQGVGIDFAGDPSFEFFGGELVEDFDFTSGTPRKVVCHSVGLTTTFRNCKFNSGSSIYIGARPGGNSTAEATGTVVLEHCNMNVGAVLVTNGRIKTYDCLFHDSVTSQYIHAFSSPVGCQAECYRTVFTMSTGVPSGHLEFTQIGGDPSGSYYAEDCLYDVEDTIGTLYGNGAGWTGLLSFGVDSTLLNCVFKGVDQVNDWSGANESVPPLRRVSNSINYNEGFAPSLTNCVLGNGNEGRCHNSEAGPQVPSAAGLVYDYDTGDLLDPVN